MAKKKEKSTQLPENDLKSVIHNHSLFFDKLIELIPARYYLPTDDTEKPWFQGLNKAEKASLKQKTRENIKKARRDRLDPEKSSSTTLDLLKQGLENEKSGNKLDGDNDDGAEVMPVKPVFNMDGDDQSVTYEELRQRLHKRIEELRSGRGGSDKIQKNDKSVKSERKDNHKNKRKREIKSAETKDKGKNSNLVKEDASEAAKGLAFGNVKIDNEEERGRKKKRKLSKEKELERAKRLEEAKKDPERGEIVAKKHSWKAATGRAAGIKVHDDPKLIKQSMQKEKRRHAKSVEKWKERVETREKMKVGKQQTRAENIADRIHQKKMRKIEKREKKLMRPGFEGRKEGYINED
ncbi:ribosomal RNA-processing protein 14-like [Malania oleifera]|uniref:ribosomal RNA-processing protein 14-like n=1 Tax=Malania oleifera TaxID=397392 RepID=UPI0025AE2E20|nr:ribosomal RNA-processing protein 14-like [Malania oleifera]XP_057979140.1 ribosomal RNA-processing protein 14-like [Malania oleifera]